MAAACGIEIRPSCNAAWINGNSSAKVVASRMWPRSLPTLSATDEVTESRICAAPARYRAWSIVFSRSPASWEAICSMTSRNSLTPDASPMPVAAWAVSQAAAMNRCPASRNPTMSLMCLILSPPTDRTDPGTGLNPDWKVTVW